MDRLASALADGLSAGDNNETIAASMADLSDNADVIATTETARAQSAATMETYTDNNVGQWRWLAEDDACPVCEDNADDSPYDVGDGPSVPEHPNCRCAYAPIITDSDGNDLTDSGDDDGGE